MCRHARRRRLARALARLAALLPRRHEPPSDPENGSYMAEWAVVTGLVLVMAVAVYLIFRAKLMAFVHGIQL